MNSLSEIVDFTGVTGTAGQRVNNPSRRRASMRAVGSIVPLLSSAGQNSMRAMILELQNLPPIGLETELVSLDGDEHGIRGPHFRIRPSSGVILETVVNYFLDGQHLNANFAADGLLDGNEVKPDGQLVVDSVAFGPGAYVAVLTRTGITNAGVTVLEKRFNFTVTSAAPQPPPRPPPRLPPPPVKPTISVSSSGSGQGSVFVVSGSGFSGVSPNKPNKDVRIRVVDADFHEMDFHQSADGSGNLNAKLGIPCSPGGLHFSATDGRPDFSDLTGFLWSNTFNIPCP
jgi:hypothetical protein